jgi:hypothetical protein
MAIEDEHAVETFKSLIQISLEGLKLLALFNGGAAVAVLAYMQTVAGKGLPVPDLRDSMTCYLFGLVTCGLAFLAGYVTQFFLYNSRALQGPAPPYLPASVSPPGAREPSRFCSRIVSGCPKPVGVASFWPRGTDT